MAGLVAIFLDPNCSWLLRWVKVMFPTAGTGPPVAEDARGYDLVRYQQR